MLVRSWDRGAGVAGSAELWSPGPGTFRPWRNGCPYSSEVPPQTGSTYGVLRQRDPARNAAGQRPLGCPRNPGGGEQDTDLETSTIQPECGTQRSHRP